MVCTGQQMILSMRLDLQHLLPSVAGKKFAFFGHDQQDWYLYFLPAIPEILGSILAHFAKVSFNGGIIKPEFCLAVFFIDAVLFDNFAKIRNPFLGKTLIIEIYNMLPVFKFFGCGK
jgi:hypothetical protein